MTDEDVEKMVADGVNKRVSVLSACDGLLSDDFKPEGKTNRQVMEAALAKIIDADTIKDKSDEYLMGVLDSISSDRAKADSARKNINDGSSSTPKLTTVPNGLAMRKMKKG